MGAISGGIEASAAAPALTSVGATRTPRKVHASARRYDIAFGRIVKEDSKWRRVGP
jgi:hypothetical protein